MEFKRRFTTTRTCCMFRFMYTVTDLFIRVVMMVIWISAAQGTVLEGMTANIKIDPWFSITHIFSHF